MEEKKTIFDYLGEVFLIYGIMTVIMNIFCVWIGDEAKELSSMFSLGGAGIAKETMAQFFLVAVSIVFIRFLFFTDTIIRKMTVVMRTVLMVISIIGMMAIFIFACDWFPTDMPEPWLMFLLCFFICFVISLGVMVLKERAENRKMEEALNRIKQKQNEVEKKRNE